MEDEKFVVYVGRANGGGLRVKWELKSRREYRA